MPGQKEKLTYGFLVRQKESGLARTYEDSEIIDAVIRGISADLPLRSYLESTPSLTLPQLRSILRVHYNERAPQELYKDLTTLVQQSKEDANQFLIDALEIRQKLMFASQEADPEVTYDPILMQKRFLHSIETGLVSQAIRLRIRPVLEKPNVTDEELIQAMRVAVSNEAERSNKLSADKSTKVNLVHDSAMGVNDYPSSNNVSDHKIKSEQASTVKLLEAQHSVETGLASQPMRLRIRPVLEKPNVTDEKRIQTVRAAVSNEAERSNNLSADKSTKVNLVQDSAMGVNDYPSSNKVSDH